MSNRRLFLKQLACSAASASALVSSKAVGANDRVRIGLIGAGDRGKQILRAALQCPNVEAVAVADLYSRRLEEAKAVVPNAKTHRDFRRLLDDASIDAVLIATPQHQHALNFVPAIQAGKDVYQEKTMAFNLDHAKRMRRALQGSERVVQIGMQMNSGAGLVKVREHLAASSLGVVTTLQAEHFRNAPYGGWRRRIPPDCDPEHLNWLAFQGEARHRPFDPQRYMNWRFFWDYSGGNVFENMVHQVGFWQAALGLEIPELVTMTGGNFFSPEMEPPDAMTVCMQHGGKVLFNWISTFGSGYYGEGYDYLFGTKAALVHNESDEVFLLPRDARAGTGAELKARASSEPRAGYKDWTVAHMQNFLDCVRSRRQPVCPFESGFRSAIACQMAVISYRERRAVRWDAQAEEIQIT